MKTNVILSEYYFLCKLHRFNMTFSKEEIDMLQIVLLEKGEYPEEKNCHCYDSRMHVQLELCKYIENMGY